MYSRAGDFLLTIGVNAMEVWPCTDHFAETLHDLVRWYATTLFKNLLVRRQPFLLNPSPLKYTVATAMSASAISDY